MPTPPNTTAVSITFTLNSTALANTPPYEITGCTGLVSYSDNSSAPFNGWNALGIGTPQANGATFSLTVVDTGYSSSNQTGIANWALTFIPRGAQNSSNQSPFGNNQNTFTGSGASSPNGGTFTLAIGSHKIKNAGNWDWMLMIQVVLPNHQINCYASDPEMEVA